jgi:hypothetical protein
MEGKFELGHLVITANALQKLNLEDVHAGVARHMTRDWGEVCDEDKQLNNQSLEDGSRVLSAYTDRGHTKFWIITEADRSVTTVLLPDDY